MTMTMTMQWLAIKRNDILPLRRLEVDNTDRRSRSQNSPADTDRDMRKSMMGSMMMTRAAQV